MTLWQPSADIFRCDGHWYVKLELAGIEPDQVTLQVNDDRLFISGQRRDSVHKDSPFYHSLEITYSHFRRTLQLPFRIDQNSLELHYQNGMLLIQLDSLEEPTTR